MIAIRGPTKRPPRTDSIGGLSVDDQLAATLAERLDLVRWPGRERRRPPHSSRDYLVLSALAAELREAVERCFPDRRNLRVVDIGCGQKPYLPLVADRAATYRGLDVVEGPEVDDVGASDALPYDDASFDLAICTQVLEHVADPVATVREIRRVLVPGGAALISTHGVFVYHPAPVDSDQDYWRWTHAGLVRLLRNAGEWRGIEVTPNRNAIACLAYLLCWYVDGFAARAGEPVRRAVVTMINRVAEALDDRYPPTLRVPAPGSLSANYLVTARR